MGPGRGSLFMVQATNRPLVALKSTRAKEVSENAGRPKRTQNLARWIAAYVNIYKIGVELS